MKTVLVLSIEGQTWQSSEVDNGITPKWKGFFADESQCTTVENEKVETNLLTQYDQCMFFLRSAGSLLDVCIYSNGIFMSMEPVGSVELHIQNEGYFNRPRKMGDRTFETR